MTDARIQGIRLLKLGAVIALAALVVMVHLVMPEQASALADQAIRSLHGPGFGIVALLIAKLRLFSGRPAIALIKSGAASMAIAVVAELAQIPGAREAELRDLLVDALGIAGFLGIAGSLDREFRNDVGRVAATALSVISIVAVLVTLWPTAWLSYALAMRSSSLPQLMSFDKPWESAYVAGEGEDVRSIPAPGNWPVPGERVAWLRSTGQWGLMLHIYGYPDWSDYTAVSFVAATVEESRRRIVVALWGIEPGNGDKAHSHYTTMRVEQIPKRYCISLRDLKDRKTGRPFDLGHMHEIMIGATNNKTGVELIADDFRLHKEDDAGFDSIQSCLRPPAAGPQGP